MIQLPYFLKSQERRDRERRETMKPIWDEIYERCNPKIEGNSSMSPKPELRMVHVCSKCKLTKLVAGTVWRQLVAQGWTVTKAGKAICSVCKNKFPDEVHEPASTPMPYGGSSKVPATFHGAARPRGSKPVNPASSPVDGDTGAGGPA